MNSPDFDQRFQNVLGQVTPLKRQFMLFVQELEKASIEDHVDLNTSLAERIIPLLRQIVGDDAGFKSMEIFLMATTNLLGDHITRATNGEVDVKEIE